MRMLRNIIPTAPQRLVHDEVRCGCGSLLARVVDGAIEVKCRRCKRVWRLALDGGGRAWRVAEEVR